MSSAHLRVPVVPLRHFHVSAALADRLDAAHSPTGASFDPTLLALKELSCAPTPLVDSSAGHQSGEPETDPDPEPVPDVDALLEDAAKRSAKRSVRAIMRRHALDAAAVAAMSETDLQALCAETTEHAKEGFRIRAALIDVRNPADPFRFVADQALVEDTVRAKYATMRSDSAMHVAGATVAGKQVEGVAQQPVQEAVAAVENDGKIDAARPPTISASIDSAHPALNRDPASLDSGDQLPQGPEPGLNVDSLFGAAAKRTASRAIRVVLRRHALDAAAIAAMSEQDLQALCAETTDCAMDKFKTRVAFLGISESLDPPRLAANQTFIAGWIFAKYDAMRSDSALRVMVEDQVEGQDLQPTREATTAVVNDGNKLDSARPPVVSAPIDPTLPALKEPSCSSTTASDARGHASQGPEPGLDVDYMLDKDARRSVRSGIRTALRLKGLNAAAVAAMSEQDLRVLCSETAKHAKSGFKTRHALRNFGGPLDPMRLAATQTFIENLVFAKYASTWSGSPQRAMTKEVAQQVEALAQRAVQDTFAANLKGGQIDAAHVISEVDEASLWTRLQGGAIARFVKLAAGSPDLLWHSSRCLELMNEEFSRMTNRRELPRDATVAAPDGGTAGAAAAASSKSVFVPSDAAGPAATPPALILESLSDSSSAPPPPPARSPPDPSYSAPRPPLVPISWRDVAVQVSESAQCAIKHVFDARGFSTASPPSLAAQARADLYVDVHHRALLEFDERITKMGIVTAMLRRRAAKNYWFQRARVLEEVSTLMKPLVGPFPDSDPAAFASSADNGPAPSRKVHATTVPAVVDLLRRSGPSAPNQDEGATGRPDAIGRRPVDAIDWKHVADTANLIAQESVATVFRTKGFKISAPPQLIAPEYDALESEMLDLALSRFDERMRSTTVQAMLLGRTAEKKFHAHRDIVNRVVRTRLRRVFEVLPVGGLDPAARNSRLAVADTAWAVADVGTDANPVVVPPLTTSNGPNAVTEAAAVHDGIASPSSHDVDERDAPKARVSLASPVHPGTLAPPALLISHSMSDSTLSRQLHEPSAFAPTLDPTTPKSAKSAAANPITSKDAVPEAANPNSAKDAVPATLEGPPSSLLDEKPCNLAHGPVAAAGAHGPVAAAGAPVQSSSQLPSAVVVAADPTDVRAAAPDPAVLGKAARRAARIAERKAAKSALPAAHNSAELGKAERDPETEDGREPETAAERDARLKAERKARKAAWSAARNAGTREAATTAATDAAQESTVAERDVAGPQVDLFSNGRAPVITPLLRALPLEPPSMAAPADPKFPFMSVLGEPSEFWYEFMPSGVQVGVNDLIPSSMVLHLAAKVPANSDVKDHAIFEWVHMVLRASPHLTDDDWAQLRAAPNERLAKANSIIFKYRNELDVYKNHILIMLRAWSLSKRELPRPSRHWLRTNALEFKYARALAGDIMDIYMTLDEAQQTKLRRVVVQMLILIGHANKAAKVLADDHVTARKLIAWLLSLDEVDPIMWCTVYLALRNEPVRKPIRSPAASQMATALARTGMPKLAIELYEQYGVVGEKRVELTIFMANAIMTSLSHLARENRNMLLEMVRWYHDVVQNHQLRPNWFMFNTLIFAHLTANDARGALHFFYERHRTHVGPVDFDSAATAVPSTGSDASDPATATAELDKMPSVMSTAARLWRPSATAQEYVRNDRVASAVLRAVATRATLEQTLQLYQMLRTYGYAVDERMVEAVADAYVHDRRLQTRVVEGTSMFADVMFANLLLIMVVMGGSILKDWREGAAAGAADTDAVAEAVVAQQEEGAAVAAAAVSAHDPL
ncbi:hypothetical protein GGF32_006072 [Allomyces javanicus]|nr:hypothetical protein GGF32_006072 [Allomyces javanicus]